MTSRRTAQESDSTGEIRLRQTAQISAADQTRTFEIAVTLPVGATSEEIERAIQGAEMGMRGLSAQMEQQISAFRDDALAQRPMVAALPPAASPNGNAAAASATPPIAAEAPTPAAPAISSSDFYRAAKALGFDALAAQKALGVSSLAEGDYGEALDRLRVLAANPPPAPVATAPRGFAEEIGPDDAAPEDGTAGLPTSLSDDLDEPDFAPVPDEEDEAEGNAEAKPDTAAIRRRTDADKRLRDLRALRGNGPPATPEQRQALANCFITPLGSDFARDLVAAIWHPVPGEKLNAARTRNLVEWSKEDDDFEETAALIFDLARQPAGEED